MKFRMTTPRSIVSDLTGTSLLEMLQLISKTMDAKNRILKLLQEFHTMQLEIARAYYRSRMRPRIPLQLYRLRTLGITPGS